jgi:hypothetical protein
MKTAPALLCVIAVAPAHPGAQSAVALRPTPRAGQILHVTSTQEFSISGNLGPVAGSPGEATINNSSTLVYTQNNGSFDEQGRLPARLTIDRLDSRQTINGTSRPQRPLEQAVGQSVTALFDRSGKLVDVQVPAELQSVSATLKQLIGGANGAWNFLPEQPMIVGASATLRSEIPLRLPGNGAVDGQQTRTVITLHSVETTAGNRIAHLQQRTESAGDTSQVTVNGGGTIDIDVTRGFVAASSLQWTIAGELRGGQGAATPPPTPVRATVSVTVKATP